MKAKIIGLSKDPGGDGYNLLLNFKGKTHAAKLQQEEAEQLFAAGKIKEIKQAFLRPETKDGPDILTKNIGALIHGFYSRKDLFEYVGKWIRYVTLSIDKEHLPDDDYFDLLLFLYQVKDVLEPDEERE